MSPLRATKVCERAVASFGDVDFPTLVDAGRPVLLRGLYRDKPLVQVGLRAAREAMDYIMGFDGGRLLTVFSAGPECEGRFFYDQTTTKLNFERSAMGLKEFFDAICAAAATSAGTSLYAGSTDLDAYFPGLRLADKLSLGGEVFERHPPTMSLWLGNRTTAATHFDVSNNIAVCLVGRRRFTLFPPDQTPNLYPGPLAPTPAGQVVSMVDPKAPDLARYPDYRKAMALAQVAELEAGDALVYPAMWWHQVEALEDFNVLLNYWWNEVPAHLDDPMNTVLSGLLTLRDRPEHEKAAWRHLFDHYVFGPAGAAGAHLPEAARGLLSPLDANQARRLRMALIQKLNR